MRLRNAVLVLGSLSLASCSHHSKVRPLAKGGPAERYLVEFQAAEAAYPGGERGGSRAPVGDAELQLQQEPGIPLLTDSCHSIWLKTATDRTRILMVREADPGSGSSFGFAWSKDARAAFIFGGAMMRMTGRRTIRCSGRGAARMEPRC
jgi:hypothetical protein